MALSLRIEADIARIDPVAWDSILAPEDLQASHRFVALCQSSKIEGASYRHLLFHEGGRPVATATLFVMRVGLDALAAPGLRRAIGAARRAWPGFLELPVAFCGLPVSFGQSCLRFGPAADRVAILDALAGAMAEFAQEKGAGLLCMKEFTAAECKDLDALQQQGFLRQPSLPSCEMALPWGNWPDLLRAMRAGYRRQVLADIQAMRRLGISVRVCDDIALHAPTLHRLYDRVLDRTEHRLERIPLAFFEKLRPGLGAAASALLFEQEGCIVAAATLLHGGTRLTFLLSGVDRSLEALPGIHPMIVSGVLAEAVRRGANTLELGQAAYGAKLRFGARLSPRFFYLLHRGRVAHRLLGTAAPALFPERRWCERNVFR
ncbi:GNAT family N-acetyltransferase [Roseomonas sp. HF4]|uniref:GNAT family N-acetyltransferase n=1 Tax=Roseomonas sp. HF4 TaxID=2562313 RepID=UPI0010C0D9E7|nr:GNAT family N-acetyltransferase [Roseomonas sp. HF4]